MRLRPSSCLGLVAAGCAALCGCAASGLKGNVYRGEGFAFTVVEPSSPWQRISATGAALAYRDDAQQATIVVNARCGLDGDDIPLQSLTQHLFLQFTEREIKTQEVVPFDGREAMHSVIDAKLDGVPMSYDVWVLKKDGCVYDMLYLAPPGGFESGQGAFEALVRGFATVDVNDE